MNIDLAYGLLAYLWNAANENAQVLSPILVFVYVVRTKHTKRYTYLAGRLVSRLDELEHEAYITSEEYRKRVLTNILLYVAELIEGVRVAVAALLAILVFLLLSSTK